jgi:DNA-binding CsgD family transcriptional regulator
MQDINAINDLLSSYRAYNIKGTENDEWDFFPDNRFIDYIANGLNKINNGFFYIFDFKNVNYKYMGENIEKILGVRNTDIIGKSIDIFADKFLLDDTKTVMPLDKYIYDRYSRYGAKKEYRVKSSYNYRMKNAEGKFIWVLQENMVLQYNKDGKPVYVIGMVSDITHLKTNDKIVFCFNSPEPDDKIVEIYNPGEIKPESKISKTECKVLQMFIKGHCTNEIAELLQRSPHTIDTYRKKLQQKTGTRNTTELVGLATCHKII